MQFSFIYIAKQRLICELLSYIGICVNGFFTMCCVLLDTSSLYVKDKSLAFFDFYNSKQSTYYVNIICNQHNT